MGEKPTVGFSFASHSERMEFEEYARQKGMTLSALAKMALFQYRAKYPHKDAKGREVRLRAGGLGCDAITVQPYYVPGGEGTGGAHT